MSDLKSKMPDMNEVTSMVGKFCTDVKNSIEGIVHDYKEKRQCVEPAKEEKVAPKAVKEPEEKK